MIFGSGFVFYVLNLNSYSFHCKKNSSYETKFRTKRLKKTKSEIQNKIDASLEMNSFSATFKKKQEEKIPA